ncbi:translation initiation factor IF-2-like [Pipra filicauda]|uniref:Translation initiation factor IF-2-like n=1 Tax=Pipra filicauda TaxID=649802 RepID=A0A6J2IBT8_9PASS|nr:translation initiation factor IF-2-like [Pipra filicauda]
MGPNIAATYCQIGRLWRTTLTGPKLCQSYPWPSKELGAAADPHLKAYRPETPRGAATPGGGHAPTAHRAVHEAPHTLLSQGPPGRHVLDQNRPKRAALPARRQAGPRVLPPAGFATPRRWTAVPDLARYRHPRDSDPHPTTTTPAHPGQRRGGAGPSGAVTAPSLVPPPRAAAAAAAGDGDAALSGSGGSGGARESGRGRRRRRQQRERRSAGHAGRAPPGGCSCGLRGAEGGGGSGSSAGLRVTAPLRPERGSRQPQEEGGRGGGGAALLPRPRGEAASGGAGSPRGRSGRRRQRSGSGGRASTWCEAAAAATSGRSAAGPRPRRRPEDLPRWTLFLGRPVTGGVGGALRLSPTPALQRRRGGPRTALRPCGWKTSFASMFMSECPRPVCCSMVPATGALQQWIGILPPVLVDHPDGCKPAEEVCKECIADIERGLSNWIKTTC